MSIGIPYATKEQDEHGWYAICPICDIHIYLTERKDFESFSAREYADHYAAEHAGQEETS
jgi:hypothetical protein